MGFADPIVGGIGKLIRSWIRSLNYVPGVSGWTVNQDGSAEFNSISIRGDGTFGTPPGTRVVITSTGIIKIYNAANVLVVQIDENGGVFGLQSPSGPRVVNASSGEIEIYDASDQLIAQLDSTGLVVKDPVFLGETSIQSAASQTNYLPSAQVGHTISAGTVGASSGVSLATTFMESPSWDGGAVSSVVCTGENAGLPQVAVVDVNASVIRLNGIVQVNSNTRPIGSGQVARAFSNVDSVATTAEGIVLTATAATYKAGRAYMFRFGSLVGTSNANGRCGFRVRKTNTAGQQLWQSGVYTNQTAGGTQAGDGVGYFNVGAADVAATLVLTIFDVDGGANTCQQKQTGTAPRYFVIEDCGSAANYDWPTTLV